MTPISVLLKELWVVDSTFRVEYIAKERKTIVINQSGLVFEGESLEEAVFKAWRLFYVVEKEMVANG